MNFFSVKFEKCICCKNLKYNGSTETTDTTRQLKIIWLITKYIVTLEIYVNNLFLCVNG